MGKPEPTGAEWAARVREDEPHGLHELEAHVLGRTRGPGPDAGVAAGRQSSSAGPLDALRVVLMIAALLGPIAGVTVFFDRSDQLYLDYDFRPDVEFPATAIGFSLAAALQVVMLTEWWRGGRHRDRFQMGFSLAVAFCAVLALRLAYGVAHDVDFPATVYLIPVWIAGTLAVLLAVATAFGSAPDPGAEDAWQARLELAQAKIQARDGDLADLPPASRRALLADRNRGVEILVERGLLVDVDVEELSQRPLGELARSEGAGS